VRDGGKEKRRLGGKMGGLTFLRVRETRRKKTGKKKKKKVKRGMAGRQENAKVGRGGRHFDRTRERKGREKQAQRTGGGHDRVQPLTKFLVQKGTEKTDNQFNGDFTGRREGGEGAGEGKKESRKGGIEGHRLPVV